MTADTIHTCSYYCERPGCIRAQRDELRERLEAALAQQPAGAPVGWRLVPVEPSEAMLDAGSQWNNEMDVPPTYAALRCIWRDMLAAAPTPPPLPDHFAAQQQGGAE